MGIKHMTSVLEYKNRLIRKAAPDFSTGCWNWKASFHRDGYGFFRFEGKMQLAHRVSYKLFKGPIPEKMYICHTCDNPACINPSHLFLGTQKDNMDDMKRKGRRPKRTSARNKEVFFFKHRESGEVFEGNSYDFRMKYELSQQHVCGLIKGRKKSCKGWIIIAERG